MSDAFCEIREIDVRLGELQGQVAELDKSSATLQRKIRELTERRRFLSHREENVRKWTHKTE